MIKYHLIIMMTLLDQWWTYNLGVSFFPSTPPCWSAEKIILETICNGYCNDAPCSWWMTIVVCDWQLILSATHTTREGRVSKLMLEPLFVARHVFWHLFLLHDMAITISNVVYCGFCKHVEPPWCNHKPFYSHVHTLKIYNWSDYPWLCSLLRGCPMTSRLVC